MTTPQSLRDTQTLGVLSAIFAKHGTVDPYLPNHDNTPNIDGRLTLIDNRRSQIGILLPQVKGVVIKRTPFKYRFTDRGSFFGYCSREKENAIILICLDPDKKIGYWEYITPEYVKALGNGKTITFPENQIISEDRKEYYPIWKQICEERIRAIEKQKQEQRRNAGVPVRVAPRSSRAAVRLNATTIRTKLQPILIDDDMKYKFYFPLISLIEPFYTDERSADQRVKLQAIFSINEVKEGEFMQRMVAEKLIKITGNLCVVVDEKRSQALLSEIIDRGTIPIEALAQLFN